MSSRPLAQAQAELVAALVGMAPDPAGFDRHRMAVARQALLHKRAGGVAVRWPYLVGCLGRDWHLGFATWATGRPTAGSLLDGWDFAEHLEAAGRLDDLARIELARHRACFSRSATGVMSRRGLRRGRSGRITVWCWGSRFVVRGGI